MDSSKNIKQSKVLDLLYSKETIQKINSSNILIVGVGGIGCELLKCFTQSGFRKFAIIDLDTIEFSNLNRQFLFQKTCKSYLFHVKQSKAEVAKQKVLEINPDCEIEAYCDNLFDPKFDNHFFKKFTLVLNALDNQEARRYLGRKCIENKKIMIDAGTSGYTGQVTTTIRHINTCNNCQPPSKQRVYNVCSIRDNPSEPIHCVVWAKNLFNMVFGPQEVEIIDEEEEQDDQKQMLEIGTINGVFTKNLKKYNESEFETVGIALFNKVFNQNISQKLIPPCQKNANQQPMTNILNQIKMKASKQIQHIYPLQYQDLIEKLKQQQLNDLNFCKKNKVEDEQNKKTEEYALDFVQSVAQIFKLYQQQLGQLQYDKDDLLSHKFVTAATNLRIHNFRNPENPQKMHFISGRKIKEMNIIHAIGSTNAIVSAIQVLESMKVIQNNQDQLLYTSVKNQIENKLDPIYISKALPAKLECNVCSYRTSYIQMEGPFQKITLKQVRNALEQCFNLQPDQYTIYCENTGTQVYEQTEDYIFQIKYEEISSNPLIDLLENKNKNSLQLTIDNSQYLWKIDVINSQKYEQLKVLTSPQEVLTNQADYQKTLQKQTKQQIQNLYDKFGY